MIEPCHGGQLGGAGEPGGYLLTLKPEQAGLKPLEIAGDRIWIDERSRGGRRFEACPRRMIIIPLLSDRHFRRIGASK
jgi:hypothetical protein